MRPLFWLLAAGLVLLPSVASAQMIPLVTSTPMANGDTEYALGIQILMVMTVRLCVCVSGCLCVCVSACL